MASHDNASASATALNWPLDLIADAEDRKAKPDTIGPEASALKIWTAASLGQGPTGKVVAGLLQEHVAVKLLNGVFTQAEKTAVESRFARWSALDHPRVLPFRGTYFVPPGRVALVSPYMKNGNLMDFITKNSISMANRLTLLKQVAEGLKYLHTEADTIHGDLKCTNILISNGGTALIGDFGLSTMLAKEEGAGLTDENIRNRNTAQFAAPELFTDEAVQASADTGKLIKRSKTKYSDVYAFGMVVYQVVAGVAPWDGLTAEVIRSKVTKGGRPPWTAQFSEHLWALCNSCWDPSPSARPDVAQVLVEITLLAPAAK